MSSRMLLRCRWLHARHGVSLIAMDEEGRRWSVVRWECSCGRRYDEGYLVDDEPAHPVLGRAIAKAIVDPEFWIEDVPANQKPEGEGA